MEMESDLLKEKKIFSRGKTPPFKPKQNEPEQEKLVENGFQLQTLDLKGQG